MTRDPAERQRLERILADVDRRLADTPLSAETRHSLHALSRRLKQELSPGWIPTDIRRRVAMAVCGFAGCAGLVSGADLMLLAWAPLPLLSPRVKAGAGRWLRRRMP